MADLNKKTYQQLINLLDKEVSIYVRNKAAVNGWCFCYTCGAPHPVSEIDAGHYISRRYYATRYDPVSYTHDAADDLTRVDLGGRRLV